MDHYSSLLILKMILCRIEVKGGYARGIAQQQMQRPVAAARDATDVVPRSNIQRPELCQPVLITRTVIQRVEKRHEVLSICLGCSDVAALCISEYFGVRCE